MNDGGDDVRRVLEATDIVRVVGDAVQVRPKGREFVCLCPFHDDRSPSMYVVPNKQIFHCFVCGAGGDALTFVRRYHGLDFPAALKMLAEQAGIELTPRKRKTPGDRGGEPGTPADGGPGVDRATLRRVNEAAQSFFQRILSHPEHGAPARALLERRGVSAEMIERFRIGASPDRWDGLVLYAEQRGIPEAVLEAAGLVKRRENGGVYDALRNRLIFPISGETGEPIAFGGRRIDDEDEPKYLNSPETALFHKSDTLFGLHQARDAIRREGWVAVVEGYTDVIACHQHGIENVVGTLGTALTAEHARRLRWKCDRVVLLFDGDEAGQRAADRAFEVLFSGEIDVSVAMLSDHTDAKDPDELLARDGGRDALLAALKGGRDLVDVHFGRVRARAAGKGAAGARRLVEDEVRKLWDNGLSRTDPGARTALLGRIAEAAGVRFEVVSQAVEASRRSRPMSRGQGSDAGVRGPRMDATEPPGGVGRLWLEMLACALSEPSAAGVVLDADTDAGLGPAVLAGIDVELLGVVRRLHEDESRGASLADVLAGLPDDEHRARAARLVRRLEQLIGDAEDGRAELVRSHAEDCVQRLRAVVAMEAKPEGEAGRGDIAGRLESIRAAHARHGQNHAARFWGGGRGAGPRDAPTDGE